MQAWFDEQSRVHGWKCEFLHLDGTVKWIAGDRLVNEYKEALREMGIEIRVGGAV
jgi:hypothetical protein